MRFGADTLVILDEQGSAPDKTSVKCEPAIAFCLIR
jgi:hypothetical protein